MSAKLSSILNDPNVDKPACDVSDGVWANVLDFVESIRFVASFVLGHRETQAREFVVRPRPCCGLEFEETAICSNVFCGEAVTALMQSLGQAVSGVKTES